MPSRVITAKKGMIRATAGSRRGLMAPQRAARGTTSAMASSSQRILWYHLTKSWVIRATGALDCIKPVMLCQYQRAPPHTTGSQASVQRLIERTAVWRAGDFFSVNMGTRKRKKSPAAVKAAPLRKSSCGR